MDYSILTPLLPRRVEQILPYAAMVEWTAAVRLWNGQGLALESFQSFAAPAGAGFRVPTGVGVALMPLKHPYDLVHQAMSTAMLTGHPFTLGIGPGSQAFQQALLGRPYASQLGGVRIQRPYRRNPEAVVGGIGSDLVLGDPMQIKAQCFWQCWVLGYFLT